MSHALKNKRCASWDRRNNSSSVAAVLQSKLYCDSDSDHHVFQKITCGCNKCYCKDKKIKPKLFAKPKTCECLRKKVKKAPKIVYQTCKCDDVRTAPPPITYRTKSGDVYRSDDVVWKRANEKRRSFKSTNQDFSDDAHPPITNIAESGNLYRGTNEKRRSFKSTNQDFRYDAHPPITNMAKSGDLYRGTNEKRRSFKSTNQDSSDDARPPITNLAKSGDSSTEYVMWRDRDVASTNERRYLRNTNQESSDNEENPDNVTSDYRDVVFRESDADDVIKYLNRHGDDDAETENAKSLHDYSKFGVAAKSGKNSRASAPGARDSSKQLNDFRKEHYFETHSVEDLMKEIPEHTCVHRFKLDDRILPVPLNSDEYGNSRCVICGKPMENPKVTSEDERTLLRKYRTLFPRYYKYGLAPRKIYMGGSDVRIETIADDYVKKQPWYGKIQKPNYCDTYALRYQDGVY